MIRALLLRLTAMRSACASALSPAAFETGEEQPTLDGLYRSPPCVCGRDVIEVTHGLAALANKHCGPAVTGLLWLVLIGIGVALLFTWLLVIDAVAKGRPRGKMVQLAAAYRRFSPSAPQSEASALPSRGRGRRLTLLVLAVLVILNVIWLAFLLSRSPGEWAVEPTSTQRATPGGLSSSAARSPASNSRSGSPEGRSTIELERSAKSARPFQPVRIQGTYQGGAHTFLRVQRLEAGEWLSFPVPTKADESGRFTAYVELGQPGRYQLRVLDPKTGVTSKPFVLVIEG